MWLWWLGMLWGAVMVIFSGHLARRPIKYRKIAESAEWMYRTGYVLVGIVFIVGAIWALATGDSPAPGP